jgi:lysozyme family protein
MFHDAMLCSGVPSLKARIMYYAVYRFGPRWTLGPSIELASFEGAKGVSTVPTDLPTEAFDADSFIADSERIEQEHLDLPAIEQLADARTSAAETAGEASLSVLATEVDASWARQPLLHRLVALQDADLAPDAAQSVGALLSRYAAQTRANPAESADAAVEATIDFETAQSDYEQLFASCQVRPERRGEVAWHRARLLQYRARYEAVSTRVGIPWWFIGIIHALEASFNFSAHLHNGDPLQARTVQVPKGRPAIWNPPNDWESSAMDALAYEGFTGQADWSLAAVLYRWERFNGMGYRKKGINSPYLWSFSNHYSKGKFVKDRVFDPEKQSRQCGAAVMLLALKEAGHVQI